MKVIAVILVVLALVIGIVPQFTDCQSQGKAITLANGKTIPMKCHWTAVAEIVTAVTLSAVGVLLFVSKRKETKLVLSVLAVVLGAFSLLLPTVLIGVCSSGMVCEIVMKPLLVLCSILVMVAGVVAVIFAVRQKETIA
ncbi:MAG: DUF4418 family protein [Anaerolineae bacterium]